MNERYSHLVDVTLSSQSSFTAMLLGFRSCKSITSS